MTWWDIKYILGKWKYYYNKLIENCIISKESKKSISNRGMDSIERNLDNEYKQILAIEKLNYVVNFNIVGIKKGKSNMFIINFTFIYRDGCSKNTCSFNALLVSRNM